MIEKNIYRSLDTIINDSNVTILEYFSVFAYERSVPIIDLDDVKTLVTYRELSSKIYSKNKPVLEEISEDVYRYVNEIRYKIVVTIDIYGVLAEDVIKKISTVLANDEKDFFNNDLAVVSFSDISNLTFLENGKYKKRYAIDVQFDYTNRSVIDQEEYIIKNTEFNLEEVI